MAHSVTYPRFVWLAFSGLIAYACIDVLSPSDDVRRWTACARCSTEFASWSSQCWIMVLGASWAVCRTVAATIHWLVWWYRRGHWLPPSRPELDTYPTDQAAWHALWADPNYGIMRPWSNLSLYGRMERVECAVYLVFGAWIWWRLSECHLCPRWTGDTSDSCERYFGLAVAPIVALFSFAALRAHFGPLPERPTRRE